MKYLEIIKVFLNYFYQDLNRVKSVKKDYRDNISLKFSGSSKLEIEAAQEWKKYLEKNRSIIVDLFQVKLIYFDKHIKFNLGSN